MTDKVLEALLERLNREVAARWSTNNDDPLVPACNYLKSPLTDFFTIEAEAAEVASKLSRHEYSEADKTANLLKLGRLLNRTLEEKATAAVKAFLVLAEMPAGPDILGAVTPESLMQELRRRIAAMFDFDSAPATVETSKSVEGIGEDEGEECRDCGVLYETLVRCVRCGVMICERCLEDHRCKTQRAPLSLAG